MDRRLTLVNIFAIVLLVVAVIGIYFMPRVNYEAFSATLEELREGQVALNKRIDGADVEIDDWRTLVRDNADEFGGAVQYVSETLRKLEERVRRLEELQVVSAARETAAALPQDEAFSSAELSKMFRDYYTEPIELPEDVQEKYDNSSGPGVLAQEAFGRFLERIVGYKLVPFEDVEQLPGEMVEELHTAFELFQMSFSLTNRQKVSDINGAIYEATQFGDYAEVPDTKEARTLYQESSDYRDRPKGSRAVKRVDGMLRFYHFPYEAHPEILAFFERTDNAKKHLFRDVDLIAQRYGDREEQ